MHRHHVEHLVGHHRAGKALGQRIQPLHAGGQVRRLVGQGVELALAQLAGELEDAVALRYAAAAFELEQQVGGEQAGAGADLDHPGRARAHHLLDLGGQRLAEKRGKLGRGDEIAARTELSRAAAVITQSRCIERELHVAGERNPAAGSGDLGLDAFEQARALGERIGGRLGQFRHVQYTRHRRKPAIVPAGLRRQAPNPRQHTARAQLKVAQQ